jgi:tRNA 2-selenouridine synthase
MKSFAEEAKKLAAQGTLNVYCWRGGMRSEKMAWLFELVGVKTNVLQSGYKAYRKFLHASFLKLKHLIVVQGPTGSGKTEILHALREAGEQVIDLEGLANHKGSAFGGLGEENQPSTQQFQNDILAAMLAYDLDKPIWIESESLTIGRVYLPEELWERMNEATVMALDVPRAYRIAHIVEQYGTFSAEELSAKIRQLQQNMGSASMKSAIELVEQGKLHEAVDILLNYYDKYYAHSASKYKVNKPISISLPSVEPGENARILINKVLEISA